MNSPLASGRAETQAPLRKAETAFTLIELLVVIAIIAILAAMLLPALNRAKAQAQSTGCKSNLRQLGATLRMYVDDANQAYPYPVYVPAGNPKGAFFWFDALAQYVPQTKWGAGIFQCPNYRWKVYDGRGAINSVTDAGGSYAYNGPGMDPAGGPTGWTRCGLGLAAFVGTAPYRPVRETDVKSPADLYAIGDSRVSTWDNGWVIGMFEYSPALYDTFRIEKMTHAVFNMLITDGHVEGLKTNLLFGSNQPNPNRWNNDNLP